MRDKNWMKLVRQDCKITSGWRRSKLQPGNKSFTLTPAHNGPKTLSCEKS